MLLLFVVVVMIMAREARVGSYHEQAEYPHFGSEQWAHPSL